MLARAMPRSTLPAAAPLDTPLSRQSSIGKRGLALRKATRGSQARTRATTAVAVSAATAPARNQPENGEHYTARVLAGEFEPTALRAREIAAAKGITLHELAHQLGYAAAPPRVRARPQLSTITRSDLAAATGYHISDISRLFARRHPPTLTKLAKVAAAYGAYMDDVLSALGW